MENYLNDYKNHALKIQNQFCQLTNEILSKCDNVIFISLIGSQNYNLDSDESDIDVQVYVTPTVEHLLLGKFVENKTIETTRGKAEIKDIRELANLVAKGNPTYIETLYTEWYWCREDFKPYLLSIRKERNNFVYNNVIRVANATKGLAYNFYKRLYSQAEGKRKYIDEFGYFPKSLSQIVRSYYIMESLKKRRGYHEAFTLKEYEHLSKCLNYRYKKIDNVDEVANEYMKKIDELSEEIKDAKLEDGYLVTKDLIMNEIILFLRKKFNL